MASTTLEWYFKSGAKQLTDGEEHGMFREIEVQRDVLYHAINSCNVRFIDRYFPQFREDELEDNPNRWADLPTITKGYLKFVAWKLGQYPDSYELFEPREKILSPGSERFCKYQRQQELVPQFNGHWQNSMNSFKAHNLGLVVSIAKKFRGSKFPLEDLAQFGTLGLDRAVYSFESSRGYKFSTYASWWIRHTIGRSIRDVGKMIRLPSHVHDTLQKMWKTQSRVEQKKGGEVSPEEIAKEMGVDLEIVNELLLLQHQEPSSLDNTLEDDSTDAHYSKTFQEYAGDKDSVSAVDQIFERQMKELIRKGLATLPPRDQDILMSRYGFDGKREKTLREVGIRYGLSRERARQLQAQAERRLAKSIQELKKEFE